MDLLTQESIWEASSTTFSWHTQRVMVNPAMTPHSWGTITDNTSVMALAREIFTPWLRIPWSIPEKYYGLKPWWNPSTFGNTGCPGMLEETLKNPNNLQKKATMICGLGGSIRGHSSWHNLHIINGVSSIICPRFPSDERIVYYDLCTSISRSHCVNHNRQTFRRSLNLGLQ